MGTDGSRSFHRGEGRSYRMGRITLTFKADDPNSAYSICETVNEPGGVGASPHRHPTYEETHIVIEGEYEMTVGDTVVRLGPGGMAFMPKGVLHAMRKLNEGTGRQLIVSSPTGVFEAFIADVTSSREAAEAASQPFDFGAVAARHGVEFFDP
jgi:mannose-6-phosphate isomerase-like protein (cupin superfamily)